MRLKQKRCSAPPLLLAAALPGDCRCRTSISPLAAFEDACVGQYGYIPRPSGTFRSDRAQYIFIAGSRPARRLGGWTEPDRFVPLHDQRDIRLSRSRFVRPHL